MAVRMTLTVPQLTAGVLRRRELRAVIAACRVLGAEVESAEQRGLLDSIFAIRAVGTREQLGPLFRLMRVNELAVRGRR